MPKVNIGGADGPEGEHQDGASKSSAFAVRQAVPTRNHRANWLSASART